MIDAARGEKFSFQKNKKNMFFLLILVWPKILWVPGPKIADLQSFSVLASFARMKLLINNINY